MSDTQLEAAQAHLAGIQLQLLDEILPAAAFLRQLEEFRTSVSFSLFLLTNIRITASSVAADNYTQPARV